MEELNNSLECIRCSNMEVPVHNRTTSTKIRIFCGKYLLLKSVLSQEKNVYFFHDEKGDIIDENEVRDDLHVSSY